MLFVGLDYKEALQWLRPALHYTAVLLAAARRLGPPASHEQCALASLQAARITLAGVKSLTDSAPAVPNPYPRPMPMALSEWLGAA